MSQYVTGITDDPHKCALSQSPSPDYRAPESSEAEKFEAGSPEVGKAISEYRSFLRSRGGDFIDCSVHVCFEIRILIRYRTITS